jgi:hypothetical protein
MYGGKHLRWCALREVLVIHVCWGMNIGRVLIDHTAIPELRKECEHREEESPFDAK